MICLLAIWEGKGVYYDVCFVRRVEEVEVVGVDLETEFCREGEEGGHLEVPVSICALFDILWPDCNAYITLEMLWVYVVIRNEPH